MNPVFHSPQWKWRVAYDQQDYGFVRNEVEIAPLKGSSFRNYVEVPTELFPLLDILLNDEQKAEANEHGLSFYLDQIDTLHWIFGFQIREAIQDLWPYTEKTLPPWASRTRR